MYLRPSFQAFFWYLIFLLVSCQNYEQNRVANVMDEPSLTTPINENGLLEGHDRLDLSLETLEQQSKDKAEAAEKLAIARKERIVIETEKPTPTDQDINIASFARSSLNQKGQSIYSRPSFHTFDHSTECAIFNSDSNAQRFFLNSGGPEIDSKNLDPDGDGFACHWDPAIYRQLAIPED